VADSEATYRLPRTVTPSRYDLEIRPDVDAGTFMGTVAVEVTIHEPVTEIVLNAKDLDIAMAGLETAGGSVEVAKVRADEEAQRVAVELAGPAPEGPATLTLSFAGTIDDRMTGFYRSTYDGDGQQRTIATTHFEATDARMGFPCWDEPDLKAVFGITLVVPEGLTAISNGPEVSREPAGDGLVKIRFADTMVMSTYLVAYVIGRLAVTEPAFARQTPVRVAARDDKLHLAGFASDVSVFALNWFADYYGIPYPDRKLDNVAIPDFAQGAMENTGCITYREQLLLLDPETSTQGERLDVAETIAHELAHQWFGNLVTMRWWNGIWLNEAFATFMSYLCVDAMHPEWRVWDTFTRVRANAFEIDSLESTRTIEYPVASPDDANGMFDVLTYTKGGAVLRMLEQWLGFERFRDGIRRYLSTHAHGNTETHDLWDAIEAETGEPARRIMDAWIFQKGYPAITAKLEDGELRLTQRRFVPSDLSDPTTWPVPLVIREVAGGRTRTRSVLVEAAGLSVPMDDPGSLVVVNSGASSFVRVFYDESLRERLLGAAFTELSPVERQCFVDDAWSAVVAGEAGATSFIDLVSGFGEETDLSVWQAILTGLGWCDRFLDGAARERFKDLVRDLVRPALGRLGWEPKEGESDLDAELRGDLIRGLGILGDDPETQSAAREAERDPSSDPAVAAAAVDVVAHSGSPEDYERYRSVARDGPTPQEQRRYLDALSRFRDPELMRRTLEATMTDEIRTQDAPFVLARSTMNRDLGPQAWAFIESNWDELTERFARSNHIALVVGIRGITDRPTVESIQSFFQAHDIPQSHQMLLQFLERQRVGAALAERARPELEARFGS
jgi:puromycin-sensitive aminopeptidase